MEVYPGDPQVKIEILHTYEKNNWQLRQLTLGTHTGTHVDAFSHMHEGGETIDRIPLTRFFGPAQVVDLSGRWPVGKGLFFSQEADCSHLPRILAAKPPFVGGYITEDLERSLLAEEIVTYTGLINLELIPLGRTFTFYGFPLKIREGDGSPVRALAVLDS